jgi:acetyl esterase/lipase
LCNRLRYCVYLISMKNFLFLFLLLTVTAFVRAQADTSYTTESTFKKDVKKFPFIKIAKRLPNADISLANDIAYTQTGKRELHLDAYFKRSGKARPAVVLIHGGGWKSGNKSQMHLLAQEIAVKGYACFPVEYRLSAEAKYPAAVLDVKEAIKYIKANAGKFNIDPTKVAVLGCSSGGQLAALIGATHGNMLFEPGGPGSDAGVQAVIDMDGILAFRHPESKEGTVAALWLGGTYEEKPLLWEQASPLTHAGKSTPPILFINSDMPRFHAGRDDMIAILSKYSIYNEVKTISNSPHSFWFFDPWFDDIVKWSVQFLDKVFKQ